MFILNALFFLITSRLAVHRLKFVFQPLWMLEVIIVHRCKKKADLLWENKFLISPLKNLIFHVIFLVFTFAKSDERSSMFESRRTVYVTVADWTRQFKAIITITIFALFWLNSRSESLSIEFLAKNQSSSIAFTASQRRPVCIKSRTTKVWYCFLLLCFVSLIFLTICHHKIFLPLYSPLGALQVCN